MATRKTRSAFIVFAILALCALPLAGAGMFEWIGGSDTMEFDETGFSGIRNETSADLEIAVGGDWDIEAVGRARDIERFELTVSGRELRIQTRPAFGFSFNMRGVVFRISVPALESLILNGSGDAHVDGAMTGRAVVLETTGSGNIRCSTEIEADVVGIVLNGSGDVDCAVNAERAELDVTGSGSIRLGVDSRELGIAIAGSGDARVEGKADSVRIALTGSGDLDGRRFEADSVDIQIYGSGGADISVSGELAYNLLGSGDLVYRGNPGRVSGGALGSGEVSQRP